MVAEFGGQLRYSLGGFLMNGQKNLTINLSDFTQKGHLFLHLKLCVCVLGEVVVSQLWRKLNHGK